jgi:hypothetical protein
MALLKVTNLKDIIYSEILKVPNRFFNLRSLKSPVGMKQYFTVPRLLVFYSKVDRTDALISQFRPAPTEASRLGRALCCYRRVLLWRSSERGAHLVGQGTRSLR